MRHQAPVPEAVLGRMLDALHHRGPDGSGTHVAANHAIAHCRLSIIDVTNGQQPISTADHRVHIAVNGEIYNYLPLRQKLEEEGAVFKTASDCEIPLHLYLRYGLEFVQHLDGMYAIAILDERKGEIILARDPVGIKPLYVAATDAGIAFASEPAAIAASGWRPAKLNNESVPCFLHRQFVTGEYTLFKGINRVSPGDVLRLRDGEIVERRHYKLELRPAGRMSDEDAISAFDALLSEKITTHLQAEAPYGAFLSGGVDSSALLSRMAEITDPVRSYTIGFEPVSSEEERALAEGLATKLQTLHHQVEFTESDFWKYLPMMCRALDDLVADPQALPTLKLAETARKDVKIILSGEGGDEIFAGSHHHQEQPLLNRLMKQPCSTPGDTHGFAPLFIDGERFIHCASPPRYYQSGYTHIQTCQAEDIAEFLPHNILLRVDRCTMTHSIEGRVPLLDREMISFAFALPDALKIRDKKGKWLLKHWLAQRHPELHVWAPTRGFHVPIHEWLDKKREKLADYLEAHPALTATAQPDAMRSFLSEPLTKGGAKLLFNLLCLCVWYDIHILGNPQPLADIA